MNFKKNKALAIAATVAMALSVPSFAQLNNGDMEYGDGGWYLWNNPDGPAVAESQIAVQGLGVDGSQGAKVVVTGRNEERAKAVVDRIVAEQAS